jgi:hypothetical protein
VRQPHARHARARRGARAAEVLPRADEQPRVFPDPYNDWDVLWQFGLSWWNDVIPMLDEDARLSVANARRLLAMLDQREESFEERLAGLPDKKQQSYRDRYIELRQFLNQAIALDESVSCSL